MHHTSESQPASADLLLRLAGDQSEWSQKTFGTDQECGPLGALLHLEKEAREAQESPDDPSEYADCLLLIIDAARRAGISVTQLVQHAQAKLEVCRQRKWPKPEHPDQPVEHIREESEI